MHKLEFFFDCSSPWTYLAFESIQEIAERDDVEFEWRPFLVGGVFNTINPTVYESRSKPVPAKARYTAKDMQDWADFVGVKIIWPQPVFPVNSVKVMRGAFYAIEEKCLVAYARRAFQSYWSESKDISQDEEIHKIVRDVGMNEDEFFRRISQPEYKDELRANTDELIERGGFGTPTLFIDGEDMYFGNDRLPLIERKLGLS